MFGLIKDSLSSSSEEKTVIVLGGGVGGLRVALSLEKNLRNLSNWKLLVIDENDYHQYTPWIHTIVGQRATPSDLAIPFSRLFRGKRIHFIQAQVKDIDVGTQSVITDRQPTHFDILVIALGSHTEFFAISGLEKNTLTLKTIADAVHVKAKVEELFLSPQNERIVVGGGGFTGVELMGELLDLVESGLAGSKKIELVLVEATDQLLPGWEPHLARAAEERLRERGAEIILGDGVVAAEPELLILKSGRWIKASLIVWTGGVSRDDACGTMFELRSRRLCVDEYSRAVAYPNVFVVGDCALYQEAETSKNFPPSAHIALESGRIVAQNVYATIAGVEMTKNRPRHYGEIVTLGRGDATGIVAGKRVNGLIARIIKKIIYLAYTYSLGGFGLLLEGRGLGKTAHFDFPTDDKH